MINRYLMIAARVWALLALALSIARASQGDYPDALVLVAVACAPWAFIWAARGTLR